MYLINVCVLFSGCTLFLNKYLIDLTDGDATLLSKATTYNRYFIVLIFLTTYLDYSNLLVHIIGADLP